MDDILKQAEEIINAKPKETYCYSILTYILIAQPDLDLIKCNYVVDGLEAIVRDKINGQDYRIIIKPNKGGIDEKL